MTRRTMAKIITSIPSMFFVAGSLLRIAAFFTTKDATNLMIAVGDLVVAVLLVWAFWRSLFS